ncbi:MAG: 50S ribosomal protein L11 methyltransferase [Thermofilaceae archaeon]|nr:50S ribosomal protein L11 methyltransferase [Thermofilaceae archaeon]MCX8180570.1 50S ribosomal protein L11 methyltransferase [Thermofilaceae archaeon]MDW8003672.1 class I SAM-dependent methyltransferase [Thermofilaceae archaeon]
MSYYVSVPFVPTPVEVVREMLRLASLKPGELLLDLGCGDGRVLVIAAKEFGARAIGIEIRNDLANKAAYNVTKEGVKNDVLIINGNFFELKLPPADVIFMYLLTSVNERLRPKLEREIKPGARIISHDFEISGWVPKRKVEFRDGGRSHTLYLYVRE